MQERKSVIRDQAGQVRGERTFESHQASKRDGAKMVSAACDESAFAKPYSGPAAVAVHC